MSLTLAIDVGSSSVRTMVFDEQGRAREGIFVQKPYTSETTPDGGAMIDPAHITRLIFECIDDTLKQTDEPIKRVAMDTLVGNLMGMDTDGQPTTPIYTWADTRGAPAAVYTPAIGPCACCGCTPNILTNVNAQRHGCRLANTHCIASSVNAASA